LTSANNTVFICVYLYLYIYIEWSVCINCWMTGSPWADRYVARESAEAEASRQSVCQATEGEWRSVKIIIGLFYIWYLSLHWSLSYCWSWWS